MIAPLAVATDARVGLVLAVFAALIVATGLSIYLAIRLYRGYRARGSTDHLLLAVGFVLLTTVPMVFRFVFSNIPTIDPTWREVLVTSAQLLGLFVIMGVIYGRR